MYWIEYFINEWQPLMIDNGWILATYETEGTAEKQIEILMGYGSGFPKERSNYRIVSK